MSDTIKEMQNIIETFCDERDWDQFHNPKDLAIGISTEANELLDLFRFKSEEQIQSLMCDEAFRFRVSEELADVLFFLLRFAQLNAFDLKNAFLVKMEKNAHRYPSDTVRGKNLKYNEYK